MELKPIGIIHSCFKQKFGIPRQAGLCKKAEGTIELHKEYSHEDITRELETFSHIWVLFHFHKAKSWNPTVRPPRLGGTKKVGVFASRSPFRPNPIGQSILKLENIVRKEGKILIHVSGIDLLDGTPVLDIKPYSPSIDKIEDATSGWNQEEFKKIDEIEIPPHLKDHPKIDLIKEMISLDPRPAHQRNQEKLFKTKIDMYDVHWHSKDQKIAISDIIHR
jgi:tRNA-Thr(GGU) m(6)t(6)A37 methyltransferase TsaA